MLKKIPYAAVVAVILFVALTGGCSKKDFNRQAVATVNGEKISILEVRELLGAPAGIFAFGNVPVDQKRRVVDQLIAVRLVAQAGRDAKIDDTQEYKDICNKNEIGVLIDALVRKEAKEKLAYDEKEIQAEADRIKKENDGISDANATGQASKAVIGRQLNELRKELVATARKETGASIDNNMLEQIGRGEEVPDNAVLASAGSEKVLFSDVKKIISEMPALPVLRGQQNSEMTKVLTSKILEQEIILRALKAYATKRNLKGSEVYKSSRGNMEQAVLANMVFDNVTGAVPQASDEEVVADYNRRVQMMQGDKSQTPPLSAVKEQLREMLKNQKRQAAFEEYIEGLRKKGKVTVDEEALKKV